MHFEDVTGDQLEISTTFCTILSSYRCTATTFSQALVNLKRMHRKIGIPKRISELCFFSFLITLIIILSLKNAVATIANKCLF